MSDRKYCAFDKADYDFADLVGPRCVEGLDAETIIAGAQVGICGCFFRARRVPCAFERLKTVAEAQVLLRLQRDGSEGRC